jgi:methyl-accepting chemotaxis protein
LKKPNDRYVRKFKNYLIRNDLQLRILAANLISMSLLVVITLFVVFYPLVTKMFLSDDIDVQYQAARDFLLILRWLVPTLLIVVALSLLYQLMITHRICGPLVNFSHTFNRMSEGDLTRKVVIRHGDYLKQECEKVNTIIDTFVERLSDTQEDCGHLVKAIDDNLAHVDDLSGRKEIEGALKRLREKAKSLETAMEFFKTSNGTDKQAA